jgi:hypothetical protein
VEDHRYVDSADFWKDQYQHMYQQKNLLEDKIHRLQEEKRLREDALPSQSQQSNENTSVVRGLIEKAMRDGAEKRKAPYDEHPLHHDWSSFESATHNHLLRLSSFGRYPFVSTCLVPDFMFTSLPNQWPARQS